MQEIDSLEFDMGKTEIWPKKIGWVRIGKPMRSGLHPLMADAVVGHGDRKKDVKSVYLTIRDRELVIETSTTGKRRFGAKMITSALHGEHIYATGVSVTIHTAAASSQNQRGSYAGRLVTRTPHFCHESQTISFSLQQPFRYAPGVLIGEARHSSAIFRRDGSASIGRRARVLSPTAFRLNHQYARAPRNSVQHFVSFFSAPIRQ